jgi:hypothetical protein
MKKILVSLLFLVAAVASFAQIDSINYPARKMPFGNWDFIWTNGTLTDTVKVYPEKGGIGLDTLFFSDGTKQSSAATGVGYMVYTALLTQTTVSSTSGLLVVGKTYQINTLVAGDDFANVGYAAPATPFVATGTTPTVWTNSTSVLNITDSAPIATILENTLGEVPTFAYNGSGDYTLNAVSAIFLDGKTDVSISNVLDVGNPLAIYAGRVSDTSIDIDTYTIDDVLVNTAIEIRVYP